jgi:nitrite reductase/ring-hydroxylating ferredoxin subunit
MTDNNNVLTPAGAEQKIQRIMDGGYFAILPYCQKRIDQRKYVHSDVKFLLTTGKVREPPKYNKKYKQWRYRVEGRIEGEKTALVVAFPSDDELECITIFFEYD